MVTGRIVGFNRLKGGELKISIEVSPECKKEAQDLPDDVCIVPKAESATGLNPDVQAAYSLDDCIRDINTALGKLKASRLADSDITPLERFSRGTV